MKSTREDFIFNSFDDKKLGASRFIPKKPIAAVIIAHGMAEHRTRYDEFAKFLYDNKIATYIFDSRGHGETISLNNGDIKGYFADDFGWQIAENDLKFFVKFIKNEKPDLPIFLFGHSMGSFLVRTLLASLDEKVSGVILSGTGGPNKLAKTALILAKIQKDIKGPKFPSTLLNKLMFGTFNKQFKDKTIKKLQTGFEWLSRDIKEVNKYVTDPLCGFVCTTSFYCDLLSGNIKANNLSTIEAYDKGLNLFIISGDNDPVGDNAKGINIFYNNLKKCNLKNVSLKLYNKMRHEILNEKDKEQVYSDIINWINTVLVG